MIQNTFIVNKGQNLSKGSVISRMIMH